MIRREKSLYKVEMYHDVVNTTGGALFAPSVAAVMLAVIYVLLSF